MTVFVCWVPLSLFCSLEVVDSYLAFATVLLCISTVSRESPDTLGVFPAFAFPGAKFPLLYKCHTAARKWLHVSGLCPLGWDVQCFLGRQGRGTIKRGNRKESSRRGRRIWRHSLPTPTSSSSTALPLPGTLCVLFPKSSSFPMRYQPTLGSHAKCSN